MEKTIDLSETYEQYIFRYYSNTKHQPNQVQKCTRKIIARNTEKIKFSLQYDQLNYKSAIENNLRKSEKQANGIRQSTQEDVNSVLYRIWQILGD
jgi:hypothetical protein